MPGQPRSIIRMTLSALRRELRLALACGLIAIAYRLVDAARLLAVTAKAAGIYAERPLGQTAGVHPVPFITGD